MHLLTGDKGWSLRGCPCAQGEWGEASGGGASHREQFRLPTTEFLETKPLAHSFSQSFFFFESAFYGT